MSGSHGGIPNVALRSCADPTDPNAPPSPVVRRTESGRDASNPGRWGERRLMALSALCAVASLTVPLGRAGLWAPHELNTADLARRLAVGLHGAQLAIDETNNQTPLLSELGKGQLPFSAIALGFQWLGLHDWAGRVPLVLAGLVSLWVMGRALSRLCGLRAAAFAILAVSTMPVFFIQTRALLGDGITLACGAVALFSLSVLTFAPPQALRSQLGWGLWALLGLAGGFASRGAALGVAVPCGAVGLAYLTCRGSITQSDAPLLGRLGRAVGRLCAGLAGVATVATVWAVAQQDAALYLEVLGSTLNTPAKPPTHDQILHRLGFGLFPWSALLPMAVVGSLTSRPSSATRATVRLVLVNQLVLAVTAHAVLGYYQQPVAFVGVAAAAGLVALAFEDYERAQARTRLVALAGCALLITFGLDLKSQPVQSLWAFEVQGARLPEPLVGAAGRFFKYATLGCVAAVALSLGQWAVGYGPTGVAIVPDRPLATAAARSRDWLRRLVRPPGRRHRAFLLVWLLFAALWAARLTSLEFGARLPNALHSAFAGRLLGLGAMAGPLLAAGPCGVWLLVGCWQSALRILPWPPARLGFLALSAAGLASSLVFYPGVARELSPRNAFESFTELSQPGEPLAVLGSAARVAPYYVSTRPHTPRSAQAATNWLQADPARRWLVLPSRSLAALNRAYRQKEGSNVPVLDTSMADTTLVSNQVLAGEHNANPFDPFLATSAPKVQHPLDVELKGGALHCLGWSVTDASGKWVEAPRPGVEYRFQIHWQVKRELKQRWKVFIHIDGQGRRHNGDHDPLNGQYATPLWAPGDYVTDTHKLKFGAEFGGKEHDVYFGMFRNKKRLPVTRGEHHEDRIRAGKLTLAR